MFGCAMKIEIYTELFSTEFPISGKVRKSTSHPIYSLRKKINNKFNFLWIIIIHVRVYAILCHEFS